jgi:YidC/Oxa1 family membrane protein insertase
MQWMMPIMITVFMLFLPQGLTLYMFTNSALGIAQQRFIEYRLGKVTAAAGVAPVTEVVAGAAGAGSTERNSSTGSGGKKTGKASARRTGRG